MFKFLYGRSVLDVCGKLGTDTKMSSNSSMVDRYPKVNRSSHPSKLVQIPLWSIGTERETPSGYKVKEFKFLYGRSVRCALSSPKHPLIVQIPLWSIGTRRIDSIASRPHGSNSSMVDRYLVCQRSYFGTMAGSNSSMVDRYGRQGRRNILL
ncbi:MAG: hypothetical protein PWP41_990 [Moorella sp. (in: firmicutes)]|nr:hypothetical protein [Moorella sp. (in: firmicutes)]